MMSASVKHTTLPTLSHLSKWESVAGQLSEMLFMQCTAEYQVNREALGKRVCVFRTKPETSEHGYQKYQSSEIV